MIFSVFSSEPKVNTSAHSLGAVYVTLISPSLDGAIVIAPPPVLRKVTAPKDCIIDDVNRSHPWGRSPSFLTVMDSVAEHVNNASNINSLGNTSMMGEQISQSALSPTLQCNVRTFFSSASSVRNVTSSEYASARWG